MADSTTNENEGWQISFCLVFLLFLWQFSLLKFLGQPVCYKEGVGFYSPAWSSTTSQNFIDPYTLSHVLHGIVLYWIVSLFKRPIFVTFFFVILLEVGWEVLENTPLIINRYRTETASLDYYGDSILNSLGDTIAAILGFVFAWKTGWKWSLALLVIFEVWMLYLAKDNLSLNILMLLYPLECVKDWQLRQLPVI